VGEGDQKFSKLCNLIKDGPSPSCEIPKCVITPTQCFKKKSVKVIVTDNNNALLIDNLQYATILLGLSNVDTFVKGFVEGTQNIARGELRARLVHLKLCNLFDKKF
jgi:hypothetical protein